MCRFKMGAGSLTHTTADFRNLFGLVLRDAFGVTKGSLNHRQYVELLFVDTLLNGRASIIR